MPGHARHDPINVKAEDCSSPAKWYGLFLVGLFWNRRFPLEQCSFRLQILGNQCETIVAVRALVFGENQMIGFSTCRIASCESITYIAEQYVMRLQIDCAAF